MTVFADTSGLYAVLDRDDAMHETARGQWLDLLSGTELLLTTNYVLVESCALVQHRLGMAAVRTLLEEIVPVLQVHWITPDVHQQAVTALLAAGRRRLSLVDCSSFVAMRPLAILHVFAFDAHFREQGLPIAQVVHTVEASLSTHLRAP